MAAQVANRAPARARRSAAFVGDPILISKIRSPAIPAWTVPRPRITKRIAEGARWCPLTVVTGAPGAGKTMAVALWAVAETGPVAWVGLDEFDNEPDTFWSYVLAALRRAGVALPEELRAQPPGQDHDDGFLLQLTAALAAQDRPVTLVLDDLHALTEPSALKGLDFMLRNAGPALRAVVTSRVDPLLPLHRYRLAGQLTEIRASDLAFSTAEAELLLAQHGSTLPADSLESLTQRTEGWAAGLRLAAISLATRPDPDQFVKELMAEDSPLICYLVDEVLNVQPPQIREVLLSTSILEHVSGEVAIELTGDERAAGILASLARTNAFVRPIGSGWYRYHTLFAEMLRLKLRYEHPDRVPVLYQRAARWYVRKGMLADAVRQAARAGDWPLAAAVVVDELAIGQLIDPRDGQRLAGEFTGLPSGQDWAEPAPHLVSAALALGAGQDESCAAALDAADRLLDAAAPVLDAADPLLDGLPAGQAAARPLDGLPAARLSAAVLRLSASLRAGDLTAATAAVARAEAMLNQVPGRPRAAGYPDLSRRVQCGRAAVDLWSGRPEEAAGVLEAGLAGADSSGREAERAYWAGPLALAEALRGRLSRAAELASQAISAVGEQPTAGPRPAAAPLVALAWVHLERGELPQARSFLKQADAALGQRPDKLIGTVAYLVAAGGALAEGRSQLAVQVVAKARSDWLVPGWLDQQLSLLESRAWTAAANVRAAVAAAERAGPSAQATVTLAHARAAAGDSEEAARVLAPVLAAEADLPEPARLSAGLADARLRYASGDSAGGRHALACALRLAEREQLRLPLMLERGWLEPVVRRDPRLAETHRRLLAPIFGYDQVPAPAAPRDEALVLVVEPLTGRELEVLTHVSSMMNTAEVASEMYISVNTVKTHLRNIYRKLAAGHRNEAVRRARQLQLI